MPDMHAIECTDRHHRVIQRYEVFQVPVDLHVIFPSLSHLSDRRSAMPLRHGNSRCVCVLIYSDTHHCSMPGQNHKPASGYKCPCCIPPGSLLQGGLCG